MTWAESTSRDAAIEFLHSRIDYERAAVASLGATEWKLERMRELAERLGDPLAHIPVAHVAGTKGKGSTAAMIASALTAAGRRTGLFSSPHLNRTEERVAIDGTAISGAELGELVAELRPHIEAMDRAAARLPGEFGPTYFEITTALALAAFRRRRVDAAVLEVGMGGRLDSTNICLPVVSVITSISLDHMRQLGDTLAAIAGEKAGIIKRGVPVVSGVTPPEPRDVIRRIARENGSRLVELDRDFRFAYRPARSLNLRPDQPRMDFSSRDWSLADVALPALGGHQAQNGAVALATLTLLREQGWRLPESAIWQGLATAPCPARVEVVSRRPTVVLDVAHNVASASALLETLNESFDSCRRALVFATTQDKDYAGMLRRLVPAFDRVVLTRYANNPRGVPANELAAPWTGDPRVQVCADAALAWEAMQQWAGADDLICVAGSFYLAAEMRALWDGPAAAANSAVRSMA
jgi:dihydrofolate synthase/folylpolyglutamate synthase